MENAKGVDDQMRRGDGNRMNTIWLWVGVCALPVEGFSFLSDSREDGKYQHFAPKVAANHDL